MPSHNRQNKGQHTDSENAKARLPVADRGDSVKKSSLGSMQSIALGDPSIGPGDKLGGVTVTTGTRKGKPVAL